MMTQEPVVSDIRVLRCKDCKKGIAIDGYKEHEYMRCPKCDCARWENLRRPSPWETIRILLMTKFDLVYVVEGTRLHKVMSFFIKKQREVRGL